jgi:adenylate cyclase
VNERTRPSDEQVAEVLSGLLRGLGVPDPDIADAQRRGIDALVMLVAERAIIPGAERLTRIEVAHRAGVSLDEAIAFWRALGFADVGDDEVVFTEVDVDALQTVAMVLNSGAVDRDLALQTTRVLGRSLAAVASALVDTVRRTFDDGYDRPNTGVLATPALLEAIDRWIVYVFRRHLVAEAKRATVQAGTGDPGTTTIGFADLVGFTGISQSLDDKTLAAAVGRFESTAVDLVGKHDGRIIKMIGDEVMFEATSPRAAAEIALDLVDAFTGDEDLPDVRVGLALGSVIRHQGDVFGEAPNLASRLVDQAYPGTVLVSDSAHDAIGEENEAFTFKPVRPRNLKGFGRTRFWVIRRTGDERPHPTWRLPTLERVLDEVLDPLRSSES